MTELTTDADGWLWLGNALITCLPAARMERRPNDTTLAAIVAFVKDCMGRGWTPDRIRAHLRRQRTQDVRDFVACNPDDRQAENFAACYTRLDAAVMNMLGV